MKIFLLITNTYLGFMLQPGLLIQLDVFYFLRCCYCANYVT